MTMKGSRAPVLSQEEASEEFKIGVWVRQWNELSATIFKIAVEGVMRGHAFRGIIFEKSVQLVVYVDNKVIVAGKRWSIKEEY